MKRYFFYVPLLLLFGITMAGCNENRDIEVIKPLALSSRLIGVDETNPVGTTYIYSGNGGYMFVYPKKIEIDFVEVDYSESIIKLSLDEKNGLDVIVAERKLLTDQRVEGLFVLKDRKGQRRLLYVFGGGEQYAGGLIDMEEIESRLLKDKDYWQK